MARTTILVIDDDKHLVELIATFLEAEGFRAVTAFDGGMALPLARSNKPALIIMDVDMPMMNGLNALSILRKNPETKNIPVIMLTGVVSDTVYPVIENLPRVSHLKKPLSLEDLRSMLRIYIPDAA